MLTFRVNLTWPASVSGTPLCAHLCKVNLASEREIPQCTHSLQITLASVRGIPQCAGASPCELAWPLLGKCNAEQVKKEQKKEKKKTTIHVHHVTKGQSWTTYNKRARHLYHMASVARRMPLFCREGLDIHSI